MVWSEEDAPRAWEDLMTAEPYICIAPDGVYVATRTKRVLCRGLSAPLKAVKDVEQLVADLAPEKPLRSVSFQGHAPPAVTPYNVFVAGPKLDKELPPTIGYVAATSTQEMYLLPRFTS